MANRQGPPSDEIVEFIAETIAEMMSQMNCDPLDRMVDITEDTPETIPLTARIEERYTALHAVYYEQTITERE